MGKIFVFNLDHEIALAADELNFTPKKNVAKITEDLSLLPLWISEGCTISRSQVNLEWLFLSEQLGLDFSLVDELKPHEISDIQAWGWNRSLCHNLRKRGFRENLFPKNDKLSAIRTLTERQTAVEAMEFLHEMLPEADFPAPPKILRSVDEVESFIKTVPEATLKSPLSESGRGVYFVKDLESQSVEGWIRQVLQQQGYIVCEEKYDVKENFAMEFLCRDGSVEFVGYSLFQTNGKAYLRNLLLSDQEIESRLAESIQLSLLESVKRLLGEFIQQRIAVEYSGYLGVDMFVFHKNRPRLYPCVEINLRPTMGLVAHQFFAKYVERGRRGVFEVEFWKTPEELQQNHIECTNEKPLIIKDGKIHSGYISLCPILQGAQYRAKALIE